MNMSEFAKRLKETRELGEIAASDLSELAGLSDGYVAHLERGVRKNPGMEAMGAIAAVLGVTIDYLVRGEGEQPAAELVKAAIATARASLSPTNAKSSAKPTGTG